jgi:DNA-binding HxlR family transcriptional regulator
MPSSDREAAEPSGARDSGDGPRDDGADPGRPPLSALAHALGTVGDRWSLLVVAGLLDGPQRFGDLQERLEGIAPNVLTQRLRALEGNGVLVAQPYSQRPLRYLYELTEEGRDLTGALRLLADWGGRFAGDDGSAPPPRHERCGTPLETRWWCPVCNEPAEPAAGEGASGGGEDLYYA